MAAPINNIQINEPFFVKIKEIHPGQSRFSQENVDEKVKKFIKDGNVILKKEGPQFKYSNNRSVLPKKEALPVVNSPVGLLLIDGHHHVKASLQVGAKIVPVKIIEDMSRLTEAEFWKVAEQKGWIYPVDLQGKWVIPPKNFSQLENDPNRYFASITALKISKKGKKSGPDHPLWIKQGKDTPFIEFKIADAMYRKGLLYRSDMNKTQRKELEEQVREVLNREPIQGVEVVTEQSLNMHQI